MFGSYVLRVIKARGVKSFIKLIPGVVAQLFRICLSVVAVALVGKDAGVGAVVRAVPVWAAFGARVSSPARLADANVLNSFFLLENKNFGLPYLAAFVSFYAKLHSIQSKMP